MESKWKEMLVVVSRNLLGVVEESDRVDNAYRLLVGKPEGNRPLRRSRPRWVYNIKMNQR
jgi:hypothetical protein